MRHGVVPATLHVDEPSPHVDWSAGAVRLLTEPEPGRETGHPRRAGVSSFGFSGTNAHVILEQAPETEPADARQPAGGPALAPGHEATAWLVSGRTADGLRAQAGRLGEWVAAHPDLGQGTSGGRWPPPGPPSSTGRWSSPRTGKNWRPGCGRWRRAAQAGVITGTVPAAAGTRVGFVFSGQGSQRAGMAAELYAACPVFAAVFDRVCGRLEAELGEPITDVVLGRGSAELGARADETLFAQAGLFAVQAGLVALLADCGLTPDAVVGHSVGELAAAYAAGVLSLDDACTLVAARARLMQALPGGGAMCAIAAGEAEVTAALAGIAGVGVAAVNGPASVVVSGDAAEVAEVAAGFAARQVRTRPLRVSHAFHSALMDPVLTELGRAAAGLPHRPPAVPWACGLTGELLDRCEPGYWVRQAREPVRYADAVASLAAVGVTVFVEIGPDGTLSALGSAVLPDGTAAFVPVQRSGQPATRALVSGLAQAHVRGVPVDWAAVLPAGSRVDLPTYLFQHERYWPAPAQAPASGQPDPAAGWRYQVSWVPVPARGAAALAGTWLVVVPAGLVGDGLPASACGPSSPWAPRR